MKFRSLPLIAALAFTYSPAQAESQPYEIQPDVVYGHKMGMALTFDVIRPKEKANGAGVLFMVSGGWVSGWLYPEGALANKGLGFTTLLDKGYTIFLVRHGSSPLFKVPECVSDVRRSVRFVRQNAANWQVDPARIGVFGMSAGGHLSLMLGTTGDDGDPTAKDPVDRVSSRVAAVAALCPPTELKTYLESQPLREQFPALQFDVTEWQSVSPIAHVTPDDAPALFFHGNKDELVPDRHSWTMWKELQEKGVDTDLVIYPGAAHSFSPEDQLSIIHHLGEWFDSHLAAPPATVAHVLAGDWAVHLTFGPEEREYILRFTPEGDQFKGVALIPDEPEHPIESITLDGQNFAMRIKKDFDGKATTLLFNGHLEENTLTGKVVIEGRETEYALDWTASKRP